MKKTQNITTFGELVVLLPLCEEQNAKDNIDLLNKAEKPVVLFGNETPSDLNMITFGQYSDLCDVLGDESDHITVMRKMLCVLYEDITEETINDAPAFDVWGMCNFICAEIKRINELFGSIHLEYTDQEKKAGIEKMQFGTFGILDWYAKRMGISDQNAVNSEKWVRIFQCMKNDNEETAYQRRLQKVYEEESRRKR